jgi:hypothetical protein
MDNIPSIVASILACSVGLSCAAQLTSTVPTAPQPFIFEGKPVHPACLWLLDTNLADAMPVCTAVDLQGCAQSNRFAMPIESSGGWLRIEDKELFGTGYFEYRWMGQLRNGVHVVETEDSGGGSGIFEDLLFVRFERDRIWESGKFRDRTQLLCCGSYSLGDRDQRPVEVRGNQVIVGGAIVYPPPE